MIVAAIIVLVAAAAAVVAATLVADLAVPLAWAATAAVPVVLVLLAIGVRRLRPR